MRTFLFFVLFASLLAGCSNDVSMVVPGGGGNGADGQPGLQGESAYTGWVNAVERGDIEWSEDTDAAGFFRFLKGADGEDGISGVDGLDGDDGEDGDDGINGVDGKTAYQLWVEAVGKGLDDPHNPGTEWDKTKTSMSDFFRFLMGRDGMNGMGGLSAYGLWVRDVQDDNGLENPHSPGTKWPTSQTTVLDFWHYLRGDDGVDGQTPNPIVIPGQPGAEVTPVAGMHNVIALYKDQAHSEYVSTADGSVLYQVFMEDGTKAGAGVVVSEMPGMAGKTFTTSDDGTFKVAKDQLPISGTTAERYGAAKVDGTAAAANTYVPQKIEVRLMIGNGASLMPELVTASTNDLNGGAYMSIPVRAQRRVTAQGEWEDLPDYMTGVERTVRAYEVTTATVQNGADPTEPNMNVMLPHRSNAAQDLRGATVSVRRPTMPVGWMPAAVQAERYYRLQANPSLPDYTPGMFTMVLDDDTGFYGENPHTRAIIFTAPVNFHPLPRSLTMSVESATTLRWTAVTFDVVTEDTEPNEALWTIDKELLFVARYTAAEGTAPDGGPVTIYGRGVDANDNKCFAVNFGTGTTLIGGTNQASVGNPSYTFAAPTPVVVGSDVYLKPSSILVAGPGNATRIGQLTDLGSGVYVIRNVAPFVYPDIPVSIL